MKKPVIIAILAAGALIAYNALAKGAAATKLVFFPSGVTGLKYVNGSPEITFSVLIQNTSNQTMNFYSLAGNIFSNGYLVGNAMTRQGARIQPNSETIIKITARLQVIGVVADLVRAIQGEGFKRTFEFTGAANFDKYQVPVNIKYQVG